MPGLQQQRKNGDRSPELPLHPRIIQLHPKGRNHRHARLHPLLHKATLPLVRQTHHPGEGRPSHLHTVEVQLALIRKRGASEENLERGEGGCRGSRHLPYIVIYVHRLKSVIEDSNVIHIILTDFFPMCFSVPSMPKKPKSNVFHVWQCLQHYSLRSMPNGTRAIVPPYWSIGRVWERGLFARGTDRACMRAFLLEEGRVGAEGFLVAEHRHFNIITKNSKNSNQYSLQQKIITTPTQKFDLPAGITHKNLCSSLSRNCHLVLKSQKLIP